jgi:alanyl-tRNA synthetase
MDSQILYQQDVTILEFETEVVEQVALTGGRIGIVLNRTYFYPTGGGQEHDTGKIGNAKVINVFKDEENSCTVHVVEGEVGLGPVHASIDSECRLRHMQHHTAQHLLTQCVLRQTGYETVSANINGYTPSTLDIVATTISQSDLDQAELMANQRIYDDLAVKTYFVSPEELQSIPLRRPPKVTENIRIVEIDGFDYSPCGGTHVLQTGSIGLIKVVRTERMNDKLRIHFIAGLQAVEVFHQMYALTTGLANDMTISWQDLPQVVGKQSEQISLLQKELQALRQVSVGYEARDLVENAEVHGSIKLIKASFGARPASELRMLGDELKKVSDAVAYLSSYDRQKVSLIVTCGSSTGQDARALLISQLERINGRGGGDAHLAQGGGAATFDQYSDLLLELSIRP